MKDPSFRSLQWILFLLLPAMGAGAQEESTPIFIDRVDVDVINVEVFVTDKGGRKVTGLTVDDFEIFEDGRPVEVSNFYAVAAEDRVLQNLERDRELFNGGGSSRLPQKRQLPEEQQLNLMVYVDHYNLRPSNQTRILGELEGFLEDRIALGDNVMLVGYNRRVRVVQDFTRDRQLIVDGLREMSKVATHGQIDDAERRRIMLRMAQYPSNTANARTLAGDDVSVAYQLVRAYTQRVRNDLRYTLDALQNVARSLAGLPGRKAVLYISDGLPKRPGTRCQSRRLRASIPSSNLLDKTRIICSKLLLSRLMRTKSLSTLWTRGVWVAVPEGPSLPISVQVPVDTQPTTTFGDSTCKSLSWIWRMQRAEPPCSTLSPSGTLSMA